ncbi:hypothetical protein AK812_SmicGene15073 [Symbiodinium microadriaticum]|uniref:Uncharacterized protein n=1 Tax=Symbiodinium microadriaticum TaxID=2951 RepID=A0A1Q9E3Z5_SYMMI|nr:hypothetical protein AK812_SmicGene15073 [Symbiodinium microadriaticum]
MALRPPCLSIPPISEQSDSNLGIYPDFKHVADDPWLEVNNARDEASFNRKAEEKVSELGQQNARLQQDELQSTQQAVSKLQQEISVLREKMLLGRLVDHRLAEDRSKEAAAVTAEHAEKKVAALEQELLVAQGELMQMKDLYAGFVHPQQNCNATEEAAAREESLAQAETAKLQEEKRHLTEELQHMKDGWEKAQQELELQKKQQLARLGPRLSDGHAEVRVLVLRSFAEQQRLSKELKQRVEERTSDCREKSRNRGDQGMQGVGEAKKNTGPTIVVVANSCVLKYLPFQESEPGHAELLRSFGQLRSENDKLLGKLRLQKRLDDTHGGRSAEQGVYTHADVAAAPRLEDQVARKLQRVSVRYLPPQRLNRSSWLVPGVGETKESAKSVAGAPKRIKRMMTFSAPTAGPANRTSPGSQRDLASRHRACNGSGFLQGKLLKRAKDLQALEHTYSYASLSIGLRASGLCNAARLGPPFHRKNAHAIFTRVLGEVSSLLSALGRFLGRVDDALDLRIELLEELEICLVAGWDSVSIWTSIIGGYSWPGWSAAIELAAFDVLRRQLAKRKGGPGVVLLQVVSASCFVHQETSEEIHLSHNQIGHRGMAQLLTALARHPHEAYPRSVEHLDEAGWDRLAHGRVFALRRHFEAIPCWLRLEHNQAAGIEHLLSVLQKDPVRLRTCLAPRGEERAERVQLSAFKVSRIAEDNPPALSSAAVMALPARRDIEDDAELAEQPQLESMVLTLCDEEKGAGLEMTATCRVPGRPRPRFDSWRRAAGAPRLAVDGEPLWGDLSEVFGREFADGASVDVVPACEASRLF